MDCLITILFAVYLATCIKTKKKKIVIPPVGTNDSFYRDEEAFTELYKAILKK